MPTSTTPRPMAPYWHARLDARASIGYSTPRSMGRVPLSTSKMKRKWRPRPNRRRRFYSSPIKNPDEYCDAAGIEGDWRFEDGWHLVQDTDAEQGNVSALLSTFDRREKPKRSHQDIPRPRQRDRPLDGV